MSFASAATHTSRGSTTSLASVLSLNSLQSLWSQNVVRAESYVSRVIEVGDLGQRDHFWAYHALMTLEYMGCIAGVDPVKLPVTSISSDRKSVRSIEAVRKLQTQERLAKLEAIIPHVDANGYPLVLAQQRLQSSAWPLREPEKAVTGDGLYGVVIH
jgi:hypothetical protein